MDHQNHQSDAGGVLIGAAPHLPEFRNLEIRGTWNGEFDGPVKLRISLEILSTPTTRLELLNTNPPAVFLETFSARTVRSEHNQYKQSSESTPQSPLFDFSTTTSEDREKASGVVAEAFDDVESSPIVHHNATLPNDDSTMETGSRQDIAPSEYLFSPQSFSALCVNVAECHDLTESLNLGKRSATDACFSDSVPGTEMDTKPNTVRPHINDVDLSYGLISPKKITCLGKDKSTSPVSQPEGKQALDLQSETSATERDIQSREEEISHRCAAIIDSAFHAQREDYNFEITSTPMAQLIEADNEDTWAADNCDVKEGFTEQVLPSTSGAFGDSLGSLDRGELSMGDIEGGLHPESMISEQPSLYESPQTPVLESEHERKYDVDHNQHDCFAAPDSGPCQSFAEPTLTVVEGILIFDSPSNARTANYKVDMIVSIYVDEEYLPGWSTLMIPGLPKLRTGESGFFLFLIPDNHGLEFITTYLHRNKMVEDCFLAEFTNLRDLVVPMRVCGQKFYGFLKNFIIDQEIRADKVNSVEQKDEQHNRPAPSMIYHAMCSLRLPGRSFSSEKCIFSLCINGGPEGSFHCSLDPQKSGLQMVHIPASDSMPIGVSRLQVICSPKNLEMFCIAWLTKSQRVHWLPCIHPGPGSCERNRDQLRHTFNELAGMGHFEEIGINDVLPSYENADISTLVSEPISTYSSDGSFVGSLAGVDDDTFDFKKRKIVPETSSNLNMEVIENQTVQDEAYVGHGSPKAPGHSICFQNIVSAVWIEPQDPKFSRESTTPSFRYRDLPRGRLSIPNICAVLLAAFGILATIVLNGAYSKGYSCFQSHSSSLSTSNCADRHLDEHVKIGEEEIIRTASDAEIEEQMISDVETELTDNIVDEGMDTDFDQTVEFVDLPISPRDQIDYWLGWRGPDIGLRA